MGNSGISNVNIVNCETEIMIFEDFKISIKEMQEDNMYSFKTTITFISTKYCFDAIFNIYTYV